MNNRLGELAKLAGCPIDGMGYGEGNVEELAELIISECIDCCYHVGGDSGPVAVDLIKVRIKAHFGIK